MTVNPLISVIMPAYNAEKYIEDAVKSVICQTYTNWELIIINDCSSDGTLQIAQRLAQADTRITVTDNAENIGVAKTRNKGLDAASGDWVALLDSDDIWHRDKLKKQLETAYSTGADIVYCSYKMIGEKNDDVIKDYIVPHSTTFDELKKVNVIGCSTVMLSKEIASQYRFTTDFYHEDLVYWLDVLKKGYKAAGVTEVLAKYRVAKGSRASNKLKSAYNRWHIYRSHLKMSLPQSICCIIQYAFAGIKKYSR